MSGIKILNLFGSRFRNGGTKFSYCSLIELKLSRQLLLATKPDVAPTFFLLKRDGTESPSGKINKFQFK